jgi:hypothetical protein
MECVFFLCPGGVLVLFLCVTGIRTDKEPTGQSLCLFGTFRRHTEFRFRVSILFLTVFHRAKAVVPVRNNGRASATACGVEQLGDNPALCCLR